MKELGLAVGKLQPLLFEGPWSRSVQPSGRAVCRTISCATSSSPGPRSQANNLLGSHDWSCGEELVEKVVEKRQLITQIDTSFVLDVAFLTTMSEEAGVTMFNKKILACLPTEDNSLRTPKESQELLAELQGGDAYRFANAAGKGNLSIARDMVGNLAMQMSPQIGSDRSNTFFQVVLAQLPYFITLQRESSLPDWPDKMLYGKTVLLWMLKKAQEESTAGQVTLETLAPLNVYSFLLDPSEIAAVEALTKGCVKSVKSSLLDCVSEVAKETCSPAKRQKKVSASEAANALFT